ncbi:MAG TPA: hypothetical protein VJU77_13435 [Chthoniobacterales bacterium]|nr:hypothetical protein [Chthoniobacterales bacterium]
MESDPIMLSLFDVVGFENRLNRIGLNDLFHAYDALIKVVDAMDGGLVFGPASSGGGKIEVIYGTDHPQNEPKL